MNILAINASPRKNGNTAALLDKSLEGAASCGAKTQLINLYELKYKGCLSCFACKLKDGKSYGKCVVKDDLANVLEAAAAADAIVLGSPIYLHSPTSSARAFLERWVFPYLVYDKDHSSLFPRKIPVALIYTMNVTSEQFKVEYEPELKSIPIYIEKIFGSCETLVVNDTYQFDNYSKYVATLFDEKKKRMVRDTQFPKDCQQAFDMGVKLARRT
ncbi:flavodoxin family protein [Pectinatus haikarae]|uniref:flavodoxin family protein n=1 Tax=Pectinatus haikarae TaxID=349096 RepID=UPI0018C70155|nr:flavodoxin family protein [Pectinatus haikarae]